MVLVYFDKESAFDSALKVHIIREVFSATNNVPSHSILYMAHMLTSRRTYSKSQDIFMEPIRDARGVEQVWDCLQ